MARTNHVAQELNSGPLSDEPRGKTDPPQVEGRPSGSEAGNGGSGSRGSSLCVVPISLGEANAYVAERHRHHKPVVGHKFSIGAARGDEIVGVVIVGRPVSRIRDDGWTLEVTRLCTDGSKNVPSLLYGAAARCAFAMGYKRIGTYILNTEPGTSLVAAGWKLIGEAGGGKWGRKDRPRVDLHPTQGKLLFEKVAV